MNNKKAKIYLIILVLFAFINCKSKTNEPVFENNPEQLKRVWMLVEFQDFKKDDLIKNQTQINLTDLKNTTAFAGCNQIGFQIEVNENKIIFKDFIATEMFCAEKMKLENEFSKSLNQSFDYFIKSHTLTLINFKNEKMVFVAQDWD